MSHNRGARPQLAMRCRRGLSEGRNVWPSHQITISLRVTCDGMQETSGASPTMAALYRS
jgi:hypothetical protein